MHASFRECPRDEERPRAIPVSASSSSSAARSVETVARLALDGLTAGQGGAAAANVNVADEIGRRVVTLAHLAAALHVQQQEQQQAMVAATAIQASAFTDLLREAAA